MLFTTTSGVFITIATGINFLLIVLGTLCFKQAKRFHVLYLKIMAMAIGGFGWFTCSVVGNIIFERINMPFCEILYYIFTGITVLFGIIVAGFYFLKFLSLIDNAPVITNQK